MIPLNDNERLSIGVDGVYSSFPPLANDDELKCHEDVDDIFNEIFGRSHEEGYVTPPPRPSPLIIPDAPCKGIREEPEEPEEDERVIDSPRRPSFVPSAPYNQQQYAFVPIQEEASDEDAASGGIHVVTPLACRRSSQPVSVYEDGEETDDDIPRCSEPTVIDVTNQQEDLPLPTEQVKEDALQIPTDGSMPTDAPVANDCFQNKVVSCIFDAKGLEPVFSLSPDGQYLAMVNALDNVIIWSVKTGKIIQELRGHEYTVTTMSFSNNGCLATGAHDKTVRIWDILTGKELHKLVQDRIVTSVSYSGDGRYIACRYIPSGDAVWDVESGRQVRQLQGEGEKSSFSGGYLTTQRTIEDGRILRIWNLETDKLMTDSMGQEWLLHHVEPIRITQAVSFSKDGRYVASATEDFLYIWNLEGTGNLIHKICHKGIFAISFTRDDRYVITVVDAWKEGGQGGGTVTIWNVESGEEVRKLQFNTPESTVCPCYRKLLSVCEDGSYIATTCGLDKVKIFHFLPSTSTKKRKISEVYETTNGEEQQPMPSRKRVNKIPGDGDCCYRSISEQVYGNQEFRVVLRNLCADYLKNHPELQAFETSENIAKSFNIGEMAGDLEISVLSELLNCRINVYYKGDDEPSHIYNPEASSGDVINLLFQNAHYDSYYPSSESQSLKRHAGALEKEILGTAGRYLPFNFSPKMDIVKIEAKYWKPEYKGFYFGHVIDSVIAIPSMLTSTRLMYIGDPDSTPYYHKVHFEDGDEAWIQHGLLHSMKSEDEDYREEIIQRKISRHGRKIIPVKRLTM